MMEQTAGVSSGTVAKVSGGPQQNVGQYQLWAYWDKLHEIKLK